VDAIPTVEVLICTYVLTMHQTALVVRQDEANRDFPGTCPCAKEIELLPRRRCCNGSSSQEKRD